MASSEPELRRVPRTSVDSERWDAVALASDDAWLWHRHAFGDALATWHDASDRSFALTGPDDSIAAIVPLQQTDFDRLRGRARFARLLSLGGPVADPSLPAKQRSRVLARAVEEASAVGAEQGGVELRIDLPPLAPAFRGDRCPRVNPLLELGLENAVGQTWVVDLRDGADAAWDRMEGRARTAVRKAEREGVTIRDAGGEDDLAAYYDLHVATYDRTGVRPHPRAYFESVWRSFGGDGGNLLVLFAEHEGDVVAATAFGLDKAGAWYWTAAAGERALKLGAPNLLQWTGMQRMVERGCEWYDTGTAVLGPDRDKTRAISDFKRSMGGDLYPAFSGRLAIPSRLYRGIEALGELRRAVARR